MNAAGAAWHRALQVQGEQGKIAALPEGLHAAESLNCPSCFGVSCRYLPTGHPPQPSTLQLDSVPSSLPSVSTHVSPAALCSLLCRCPPLWVSPLPSALQRIPSTLQPTSAPLRTQGSAYGMSLTPTAWCQSTWWSCGGPCSQVSFAV